jgi:hypothetical protein
VWQHAADNVGAPLSTAIWLDGHQAQLFERALLRVDKQSGEVVAQQQPPGWHTLLPTDVLRLRPAPQRAEVRVEGAASEPLPAAAPLQPLTLTLHIEGYQGPAQLCLYDARLRNVVSTTTHLHAGQAAVPVLPRGTLGPQWALVLVDGKLAAAYSALFTLDATTEITTGFEDIDRIYPMARDFMQQDVVSYVLDGHPLRGYRSPDNPLLWLRDHVYQARGFRYFEHDMTSLLDAFRRAQRPDGSFPDFLTYPALHTEARRLESESDLEFLFAQGVYEAWQATGDDSWLAATLPAVERGLTYITSDPLRWTGNPGEPGLVRRPYTIDMWDFQYGPTTLSPEGKLSPRHWIDKRTVWGIFHGDNTGLAYALRLMERTAEQRGSTEKARRYREQRRAIMRQLNELSWNGSYFYHFVLPDGSLPRVPGVDTAAQLSLSNAYALNREVLRFEQGRGIIEAYHKRRNFERAFAEWYSIDPPFPTGSFGMAGGKGEQPGEYVNGGIMPLVGGELARGAFSFGAEEYGFDILRRYSELIRLTNASYLWYYPDGRAGRSGEHTLATDGWGAGAMIGALIEGAAGVVDKSSRYRELELSPRWGALPDMRRARVVARYGGSDGYVAYTWTYDKAAQQVHLSATGTWENALVRLMLPPDGRNTLSRALIINGEPREVEKKKIGSGEYIVFEVAGGNAEVTLSWVTEETQERERARGESN